MPATESKAVDPPDGGWGWMVVLGVFIFSALTFGAMVTYPLFFTPMMQEFNIGFGEVTWLTGVFQVGKALGYLSTPGLLGTLGFRGAGILVAVVSGIAISVSAIVQEPVIIYILAGGVPGFVMGLFVALGNVVTSRYFVKRRLLAVAIGQTGSGIGTLALAPVIQYFIDLYGWRGGMLLLGGLTFNIAVASALFRPIHLKTDGAKAKATFSGLIKSGRQVLKLPKIWLLCGIWFCVYGGMRAYLRFVVPYAQEVLYIEPIAASFTLSLYSISSVVSRVVFGAVGDRTGISPVWTLMVTQLLAAVTAACLWFTNDYAGLLVNSVASSFVTSTIHVMYVPVVVDIVGERDMAWGYTTAGFISAVTGSAIVPLIGMWVDASGEMRFAFISAAILGVMSALLHIPLLFSNKGTKKGARNEDEKQST